MSDADSLNRTLAAEAPALHAALSPVGLRAIYPRGIPFQAAEARGKTFNGTIGQITDGHGRALPVPAMAAALAGLGEEGRNRGLLYSPMEGFPDLRREWAAWQKLRAGRDVGPTTLPLVTAGIAHSISIVADLFGGDGRTVAVAQPYWGNYRQIFWTRTGARLATAPFYRDRRFDPAAPASALAGLPAGEPAIAILNFPSNPGGYMPSEPERRSLVTSLVAEADRRPLVVLCDDAYLGLVFEDDIPRASLFWDLVGAHPNLVPVKCDGATKEFAFFGGRVGFLTFALPPDSTAAAAIESKAKCLLRATIGSPVATSQAVLLAGITSSTRDADLEAIRLVLAERYRALRDALAGVDPELLAPLPFNSGCFAVAEIPEGLGVSAEAVRRHLLEHHDTGVVAIDDRFLRLAFCATVPEALPELVRRVELALKELAGRPVAT